MSERLEALAEAKQAEDLEHYNNSGRVALMRAIQELSKRGVKPEDRSPVVRLVMEAVGEIEPTLS